MGGATWLLLQLGRLTSMCSSMDPNGASIARAVYADMDVTCDSRMTFEPEGLDDPEARKELKQYMMARKFGVVIGGVLITIDLVVTVGLRSCLYIPILIQVVGKLIKG